MNSSFLSLGVAARNRTHTFLLALVILALAGGARAACPNDSTFNSTGSGAGDFPGAAVYALAVEPPSPSQRILIGGNFTSVNGVARNFFARLYSDGYVDTSVNVSFDGPILAMARASDGSIYVGGGFTSVNGQSYSNLVKLNSSFAVTAGYNVNGIVHCIAIQPWDGKVLVGGNFSSVAGITTSGIFRINGNKYEICYQYPYGSVYSIAVNNNVSSTNYTKIYVGGNFNGTAFGPYRKGLAAYDSSTLTVNSNFDPGSFSNVWAVAVANFSIDGITQERIVVGGDFVFTGERMARLKPHGQFDQVNHIINNRVQAIQVQTDGKIVIGGWFTSLGGSNQRYGVARFLADDSMTVDSWAVYPTCAGADSGVWTFALQGSNLIAGGYFTQFDGVARGRYARLIP